MPSIPTDALLNGDDLMHLDDALDFEVDEALAFVAPRGSSARDGLTDADIRPISSARHGRGPSSTSIGTGFTMGSTGSDRGNSSDEVRDGSAEDSEVLDRADSKYKRRIQNRLASARFRAKAKERQNDLDKLKSQVMQLRREKRELEEKCSQIKESAAVEAERQRASTVAWIADHFWLRRKVHFKTLANSVRWMVTGRYEPGMSEAAAELMAQRAIARNFTAQGDEVLDKSADEIEDDQDLSGFGDDDAPAGSADPARRAATTAFRSPPTSDQAMEDDCEANGFTHATLSPSASFGQRVATFFSESFERRLERRGRAKNAKSAPTRPHTR